MNIFKIIFSFKILAKCLYWYKKPYKKYRTQEVYEKIKRKKNDPEKILTNGGNLHIPDQSDPLFFLLKLYCKITRFSSHRENTFL